MEIDLEAVGTELSGLRHMDRASQRRRLIDLLESGQREQVALLLEGCGLPASFLASPVVSPARREAEAFGNGAHLEGMTVALQRRREWLRQQLEIVDRRLATLASKRNGENGDHHG
jgi:hypothetical protein